MPRYRDDDDDRDDYDRDDRPRSRRVDNPDTSGSTAVKIIAIIGAALLAVFLVCGGVAWYVVYSIKQGAQRVANDVGQMAERQREAMELEQKRQQKERETKYAEKQKATRAANTFLSEAKAGRHAEAYALTTAAYRGRVSQQQFIDQMTKSANTLRGVDQFRDQGLPFEHRLDPPFAYESTKPAAGGWVKVELTVMKEGEAWKVDQVFVGTHDPFKP